MNKTRTSANIESDSLAPAAGGDAPLAQRLGDVLDLIAAAARRAGRDPEKVILVAVTKHASIDQIRELINLGHVDLGESRVQQLVQRSAQIDEYLARRRELAAVGGDEPIAATRWHMIGHLQRNKVRKILPLVRLVHSVDSLRLAEEMQAAAARLDTVTEVLIQVNASNERNKHGIAPAATRHLIDQMDTMINLRVRGLMTMAADSEDPTDARPCFELCRELFEDTQREGIVDERFNILSMGMSNDFEVAVECGANVVRVGSAIFGNQHVSEEDEQE